MVRLGILLVLSCFALRSANAADSPALELARQLNAAFIEVADKVSPSVVVIRVAQPEGAGGLDESSPLWDMMPHEFRRRFEQQKEQRQAPKEKRSGPPVYNGRGSGIIISDDGYILTNFHVVDEAEAIQVRLRDGRKFTATVRGSDEQSDVAVLKIDATNLTVARLGDSAATKVGEFVVAIGAPFDLDYSVTYGHVSAKGRSPIPAFGPHLQGASMDQDFLQTDASINPGNSGGPLVNLYGEVIGINTLIRGLHTGIGFAIPVNHAREISTSLIKKGKFVRSWLGVGIRDLEDDEEFQQFVPDVRDGVLVTSLQPGGPASKSDLRPRDLIRSVDGRPVGTSAQLRTEVRTKPAGTNVTLDVVRLDEQKRARNLKIKVSPEPWPEKVETASGKNTKPVEAADLGIEVEALSKELRTKYELGQDGAVVVTKVQSDTPASTKLKTGDVILAVNHQEVSSVAEFSAALAKANLDKGVIFDVLTSGNKHFVVLRSKSE